MKPTLWSLLLLALVCCTQEPIATFEVQQTSIENIKYQGEQVSLDVRSTAQYWTVESNQSWCTPLQTSGSGDATVLFEVAANIQTTPRTAAVTLSGDGVRKQILLTQQPSDGKEYHYQLPVIVHVLYANAADPRQTVPEGYMAEVFDLVNKRYTNNGMDVEFVMTPTDPAGKPLEEPGMERIRVERVPIDIDDVMAGSEYKKYLWDPNLYINIFVYPFTSKGAIPIGIAHLPITPRHHYLDGTNESTVSVLTLADINYTPCASFNTDYLYERSSEGCSDLSCLNSNDFVTTAAHELGHYLGLLHTFTENELGEIVDDCFDSDYCLDTPTYNRIAYETWYLGYFQTHDEPTLNDLIQRTSCTGAPFVSDNVMDYYISLENKFTADQRARVRHVLTYSPLIPGPKIRADRTTFTKGVTPEIPFRSIE